MRRLSRIHRDDSLTSTEDAVGHRPEFKIWGDARIDFHIHKTASGTSRQKSSACVGIWHGDDSGFAEALPKSFIIPKEEHPVALDWPTDGAAKLISAERRDRIVWSIEKVLRIHAAVTEEFICRSMKIVRARFRNGIHHRTIAAVLRAVRVRQHPKLRNGVDAH